MAAVASSLVPQFSGLGVARERALSSSSTLFFHRASSPRPPFSTRRTPRGVVAMAGTGKFFVGGNWKCNGMKDSISKLVADLNDAKMENDVDVVIAPPFIYIDQVNNSLTDRIDISAQNCWVGKGGAFTGEIRFARTEHGSKAIWSMGQSVPVLSGDIRIKALLQGMFG